MSFEYIIERENAVKSLDKEEEASLVKNISSKFVELNRERSANLEMASKLSDEIFFKTEYIPSGDKNQKWKSKIKMCKTYMFYQTLKAFIWRNTYANVNSMSQEKTTTRTTQATSKKLSLWTLWKKWITRKPVTKLSITLCFMEN